MVDGLRLGVDFGTSNTAAVLHTPGGRVQSLLFDGERLLPSAVFAPESGELLVGRDAVHAARLQPERFEPNPKRRIDEGTVLLGDRDVAVEDLIAAVLRRVHATAREATGGAPFGVVLTHPAAWAGSRRARLLDAAARAGMAPVELVAEPVAAGTHLSRRPSARFGPGMSALVYDFGAGTFDASVIRHGDTIEVVAEAGRPHVGGLDIDQAVFEHLGEVFGDRPGWSRLRHPQDTDARRESRRFRDEIRVAKEFLARNSSTRVHVPLVDAEAPLGREVLDRLARPFVQATIQACEEAVRRAGLAPGGLDAIYLVGGSSRLPLVHTMLLDAFRLNPTMHDQPEVAVAEGGVLVEPRPAAHRPGPAGTGPAADADELSGRHHTAAHLVRQGRLNDAEREAAAVVEERARLLGPGHPDTAQSRLLLGGILLLRDDPDGAGREFQQARDALRESLGARHRETLRARYRILLCRLALSADDLAPLVGDVNALLEAQRGASGAGDPDILATRGLAAFVEARQGEPRGAREAALREVLAAQLSTVDPDDPAAYRTWLLLVAALTHWGDHEAALREAARLRASIGDELGEAHPFTGDAADVLCGAYVDVAATLDAQPGRAADASRARAKALDLSKRNLRRQRELLTDEHHRTVRARLRYGECLFLAGQRADGLAQLRAALEGYRRQQGPGHVTTLAVQVLLATRLAEHGDTDAAEPLFRDAVAAYEREFGPGCPQAEAARRGLSAAARRNASVSHRFRRWINDLAE
ncbi:Hsp70 family protein [Dactylosporangium sp. CA-139066]|uniref:Hsp70 family protein n=1 Tax=Dactylosporangium sp. CA-139066 TaxID=3239930 RepID=UPI003D89FBBF